MKKLISIVFILVIAGCVTQPLSRTDEAMLPNGDWSLRLLANVKCSDFYNLSANSSGDSGAGIDLSGLKDAFKQTEPVDSKEKILAKKLCMEKFKKGLSSRAAELCGEKKFEIYGCVNSEEKTDNSGLQYDTMYGYYMTCYLRCNK